MTKERYISPRKDKKKLIIINSIIMKYQKKNKLVKKYTKSTK